MIPFYWFALTLGGWRISHGGAWTTSLSSSRRRRGVVGSFVATPFLHMGLYDEPLPPRPAPIPNNKKKSNSRSRHRSEDEDDNEDDDNDSEENAASGAVSQRLFSFTPTGKEVNDLLPNLGRRLDSGVECYFEATDRKVITLVEQTGANVDDVCWALEACRGDVTEAWTSISTARRMQLIQQRASASASGGSGSNHNDPLAPPQDLDLMELEMEEEFAERKEERRQRQQQQDREEFFRGGTPDQPWLPRKNPNPVEDEPWFTG